MTPSALRDELQATLSGTYTVERELGGGGMSRVFVANELRLGRKVVVKLLSPDLAAGVNAERFEREIRVAASLQQANIVPVLASGEVNGIPYYTMPFVEGESLRARLATGGPPSITETLRILGDVSRALTYAHEHGVVHRDIKPDNVLLSGGTAVVTDFGIAKAIAAARTSEPDGDGPRAPTAALTAIGTTIGTPAYMSPEQAAGDPTVDHRADLYSLGCLAYELLSGRTPFDGRTPSRTLAAHMGEAPQAIAELRPDTPPGLAAMVMQCLAKSPDDRPNNAREVVAKLDAISSGGGIAAMPASMRGGPRAFRNALLIYLLSFAVVAVVARAAIVVLGLPDWAFAGTVLVMLLGLPVVLFTGYVHRVTQRALTTTPKLTPGGGQQAAGTMATLAMKASPHVSWERTAKGGAIALASFVILVGATMTLRAYGLGPEGSLLGAGRIKENSTIVISDFRMPGSDSSLVPVISEAVRSGLEESSVVSMLDPTTVAEALTRMKRPAGSRLDSATAREVAQREGAFAVLDGDVAPLGTAYVVSLRLISADSGKVLSSFRETASGPTELIPTLGKLTRQLRSRIGESFKRVRAGTPLEQATTTSLEALRYYSEAGTLNGQRRFREAEQQLRKAVAIDPEFATAWGRLATVLRSRGGPGAAVQSDSAIQQALRFTDRLSNQERLMILGRYYSFATTANRPKAFAAYDSVVRLYPTNGIAANNLSVLTSSMRDFARSDTLLRMAVKYGLTQSVISARNLASVLVTRGQLAAADSAIAIIAQRSPNDVSVRTWPAELAYARGMIDTAETLLRRLPIDTASATVQYTVNYLLYDLSTIQGRLADSRRYLATGRRADSARATPMRALNDSISAAIRSAWFLDDTTRSSARIDAVVARFTPSVRNDAGAAAAYALARNPAKAKALLAAFESRLTDSVARAQQTPYVHYIRGEIALAEGRALDAVTEFRVSDQEPDGPSDGCVTCLPALLARAYDRAGMADSAIANFERYITTPWAGRVAAGGIGGRPATDPAMLAGAYKRLGELYEQRGDTSKAIANLEKFVDLWRNADTELQPRVKDAQKRLDRLRRRAG